jgi:hypothetical protein
MLTASIQKMIAATGQETSADKEQMNAATEARSILSSMWDEL